MFEPMLKLKHLGAINIWEFLPPGFNVLHEIHAVHQEILKSEWFWSRSHLHFPGYVDWPMI
jgi:hypothetical protein